MCSCLYAERDFDVHRIKNDQSKSFQIQMIAYYRPTPGKLVLAFVCTFVVIHNKEQESHHDPHIPGVAGLLLMIMSVPATSILA